jgi:DNA-binding transcriptional ArsR family regulator
VRARALSKYMEGETSPSAVASALSVPLNVVSHHTQVLLRAGAIELVRTQPRRGATEHFYRAVLTGEIEDTDWSRVPVKLRRALARIVIDGAMRESGDALPNGGMDGESTHLSRNYFVLDAEGQRQLASLLRETVEQAEAIARASHARAAGNGSGYELVVMAFGADVKPRGLARAASVRPRPARTRAEPTPRAAR